MFDISWGEFLVIGVVALIVIGPHQLPGTLRGLGRAVNKLRGMASDFRTQFDDAMREAELHDVAKDVSDLKSAATGGFNPVETIRNEIKGAVEEIKGKAADGVGLSDIQSSLADITSEVDAAGRGVQPIITPQAAPAAPQPSVQPASVQPVAAPVAAPPVEPPPSAPAPEKPPRRKKALAPSAGTDEQPSKSAP
jgi:sec-independent protein translocase protein TatB